MIRRAAAVMVALLLVAAGWRLRDVTSARRPRSGPPVGLAPARTAPASAPARAAATPGLITATPARATAPPALPRTAPQPGPGGNAQIEVMVSSDDVPACIPEGDLFRAQIRSTWRGLGSIVTLTYRWAKPASGGAILVQLLGSDHKAEVAPGEAFPKVELSVPAGDKMITVPLTTFVFDHLDAAGRACLVWAEPPGAPRRFEPGQQARGAARQSPAGAEG